MKLQKRDFAFFVLGGVIFLIGSLFTPFQAPRVDAQAPFQEWIQCSRLDLLDENGRPLIILNAEGQEGGVINVYGKGGFASVSINKDGGLLRVEGEKGSGQFTVDEKGVRFSVKGDNGKSEVLLSADEHGGVVSIRNETEQEVGTFRVSEKGDGVLRILDKQGKQTGSMP